MAAKRTRKLLVWALFLHTFWVFGQTTFQKTIGGSGNEAATWVTETLDGYLVAGNVTNGAGNQDALLVRLDRYGAILWQKRFGAGQSDAFNCVVNTPDGGYLAVGETRSFGAGNLDIFLVKINASGTVVWSKTVGDADKNDSAHGVIAVSGGGFVVSGASLSATSGSTTSVFLRLDSNGNTLWSRKYSTASSNLILSNYIDGNVIYASGSANGEGVFVRLELSSGSILSSKTYAGNGTEALSYQQPTADGNLLLADHTLSPSMSSDSKVWVQKVNRTSGQVLWSKVYHRLNDNICGRIEKVNDGGFLLVPFNKNDTVQADALLAKIDPNGNLIWSYNYGGNASDRLLKAVQTLDGGFIAVGDTRSSSMNGSTDILIVKTDLNGHIQGNCAKDANVESANFASTNSALNLTTTTWTQGAAALAMSPLSINLQGQTFMPNAIPVILKTIALCPNVPINISGTSHFAPKMVTDTVSSLNGCDTVFMYNLTQSAYNTGIHVIGLCDGQTYTINGIQYTAPATVLDTVPSLTNSCDTICNYVLKVWVQPTEEQTISFCPGETVLIGGQMYSQPGIVKSTKPSTTNGCDTLVTYTLLLRPQPTRTVTISFCPGESVVIGGNSYGQSGTVTSMVPATNGTCDTLVTYTLELKPQPTRAENRTFCPGQSVVIAGQSYNQSGTVVANLASNTGGCDTIVTYTLQLNSQPTLALAHVLCPGQSILIGGQIYNQAGTVIQNLASTSGGCDTIVTHTLEMQAPPSRIETRTLCPGQSVWIDGQSYNQPGTVFANIASTTGGCDTVVKYILEMLPQPVRAETLGLCPGETLTIAGQQYNLPGIFVVNLPSIAGACDTVVTYTILLRPQPSRSETLSFCPGESVIIAGQTYAQEGDVVENIASNTGGCDTVVTYKLQFLTPAPSNIALKCPANMTSMVVSGSDPVAVTYGDPIAASDCICPGLEMDRTSGLASGSLFPVGNTQVCYRAKDNCGQEKSCCFSVKIIEEEACEVKTNGCIRYELLSITADPFRNRTYRIRVTNNCASKLIHTAIQIPDGLTAMEPANNSTFGSSENRNYLVRSPNFSPMYSIRFKSTTDSISNGESDVFEYTLPAQAEVAYLSIVTRLAQQAANEAYLTTFNCPVGVTPASRIVKTKSRDAEVALEQQNSLLLFPNPTQGVLFADLSDWEGKKVQIQVTNALGQLIHTMKLVAGEDLLRIEMPQGATNGIYFMEVAPENGKKEVMRFMIQR
jgi:hypothetical protein